MKSYIFGGTAEELSRVTAIAAAEGYDVEDLSDVLAGFRRTNTVQGAARRAGTSPGSARRVLRYFGMIT